MFVLFLLSTNFMITNWSRDNILLGDIMVISSGELNAGQNRVMNSMLCFVAGVRYWRCLNKISVSPFGRIFSEPGKFVRLEYHSP